MGYIQRMVTEWSQITAHSSSPLLAVQDDSIGQVLVVGTRQVGKYTLVNQLLRPAGALSKQCQSGQLWALDTKYYTSAVKILRLQPSPEACKQATTSQGLVLVFDANSEASFLAVSAWAEQLSSLDADIRLCVANKVDELPRQHSSETRAAPFLQRSSWLQAANLWCAENQFEYVEVSSTDQELDEALVWEEQQQGVFRVKQALEANYWPGLDMKNQSRPHAEGDPRSRHTAMKSAANLCAEAGSSLSGESDSDVDGFNEFQSAEEADLDQFEKMFGELRGKHTCTCSAVALM